MINDTKKKILKNKVKGMKETGKMEKKEHMMPGGEMMNDKDMPMDKYKNLKKK